MTEIYFEDLSVGQDFELSTYAVTKDEIIEFAEQFDPQYFHLDAEAAKDSLFGGLCASGWHTVSIANRLYVDDVLEDVASLGGRGVDRIRWHQPVRPGDKLTGWVEVVAKRPHKYDDSRGDVDMLITIVDENGDQVLTFFTLTMIGRRPD